MRPVGKRGPRSSGQVHRVVLVKATGGLVFRRGRVAGVASHRSSRTWQSSRSCRSSRTFSSVASRFAAGRRESAQPRITPSPLSGATSPCVTTLEIPSFDRLQELNQAGLEIAARVQIVSRPPDQIRVQNRRFPLYTTQAILPTSPACYLASASWPGGEWSIAIAIGL